MPEGTAGGDPGTTSGSSGTSGSSTGNGSVPPAEPNAAAGEQAHESSACQMGPGSARSGALSVLVLLGALFGLKRRRAA